MALSNMHSRGMKPFSDEQLQLFDVGSEKAWSYSRLKTLRRCALEYKVRWLTGEHALFQPGYIDVQSGRLLHHVLREYYRSSFTSKPYQLLLKIYEKLAPRTPAWRDDLQGEARTLAALRDFADSKVAHFRPVGLEVGCKARIGGVVFAGQADLVYQTDELPSVYGILEFKLNDVEVRSQDPTERFLQCMIYYIGLPEEFHRFCKVASIYVFDTGELLETKIEQSMTEETVRVVQETLPRAEGPDFPATLNPFCPSCGYQNLCPAYSKSRSS